MYVFNELQNPLNYSTQKPDHIMISETMRVSDERHNKQVWENMGNDNHQIIGKLIKNNYDLIATRIYTGGVTVRYKCNTGNDEGVYEVIEINKMGGV